MLLDKKLSNKIKSLLRENGSVVFEYSTNLTKKYIYNDCISTNKNILVITSKDDISSYEDVGREIKVIQQSKFEKLDCNSDEELIKKYFGELKLILMVDLDKESAEKVVEIAEVLSAMYGEGCVRRILITKDKYDRLKGYELLEELTYKRKVIDVVKFLNLERSMPVDVMVKYFNNTISENEIVTILSN